MKPNRGRDAVGHRSAPAGRLGSQRRLARRTCPGSTMGPRARNTRRHPATRRPAEPVGLPGISLPWEPTLIRPSHGGARLIIVRSMVRIHPELSRETPAQTGFLGSAESQGIVYSELCGSVLEAIAPLRHPERQWSSCERRNQSLWPGASCSTGSWRAAVSLCTLDRTSLPSTGSGELDVISADGGPQGYIGTIWAVQPRSGDLGRASRCQERPCSHS